MNQNTLILAILALAVVGLATGYIALPQTGGASVVAGPATTTATTAQGVPVTVSVGTITFSVKPYDMYNMGTTPDLEAVLMDGTVTWDTDAVSTGTTTNVTGGAKYKLYMWDDGQTTNLAGTGITLDSSYDWYGYSTEFTLPIASSVVFPTSFTTDYKGHAKEGALSTQYEINSNGSVNSGGAEDLTAGSVKTVKFVFDGPNNACFGSPYSTENAVLALDYNTGCYSKITVQDATERSVPDSNLLYEKAYTLPFNSLCDNAEKVLMVTLEVRSDQEPAAATCDIHYNLYDPALWYDSTDNTGFHYGIENTVTDTQVGRAVDIGFFDVS